MSANDFFSQRIDVPNGNHQNVSSSLCSSLAKEICRRCDFQGRWAAFYLESSETFVRIRTRYPSHFWSIGLYVNQSGHDRHYTYSAGYSTRALGKLTEAADGPLGCLFVPFYPIWGIPLMGVESYEKAVYRKRESARNELISVFALSLSEAMRIVGTGPTAIKAGPEEGSLQSPPGVIAANAGDDDGVSL